MEKMKVKCIDKGIVLALTLNKEYNVIKSQNSELGITYLIINDNNEEQFYTASRFEIVNNTTNPEHYNHPISPLEYITKNNLGFSEGNIIKYITRYKQKNGKEDLLKAKEYLEHLINNYENNN
jgi:hypothetical protein